MKFKEVVLSLAGLVLIFGLLISIDPRLREQAGNVASSAQTQQWSSADGPIRSVAADATHIVSDYASGNPILFAFLVVAVVLFMMMLRT